MTVRHVKLPSICEQRRILKWSSYFGTLVTGIQNLYFFPFRKRQDCSQWQL